MDKKFLFVSLVVLIGIAHQGATKELISTGIRDTSERKSIPPRLQHALQ